MVRLILFDGLKFGFNRSNWALACVPEVRRDGEILPLGVQPRSDRNSLCMGSKFHQTFFRFT